MGVPPLVACAHVALRRFTFFAPKTGVWLSHVPVAGEENQDFEDMQKYKKYGIIM